MVSPAKFVCARQQAIVANRATSLAEATASRVEGVCIAVRNIEVPEEEQTRAEMCGIVHREVSDFFSDMSSGRVRPTDEHKARVLEALDGLRAATNSVLSDNQSWIGRFAELDWRKRA